MNATVIGSQLGDEGKGAIVDVFGADADVVVRYQGGDNAGHTVSHRGQEYKLRLVPSGVVQGAVGVLGNGCVVNLATLFDELDELRERGLTPDVRVAGRAHVVLPYHRLLDRAEEAARAGGTERIGTTGNGIGPAYEDKVGRRGIRVAELTDGDRLRERLEYVVPRKRRLADAVSNPNGAETAASMGVDAVEEAGDRFDAEEDGRFDAEGDDRLDAEGDDRLDVEGEGQFAVEGEDPFDVERLFETLHAFGERLETEGMIVDSGAYLAEQQAAGRTILFEGAQGTHIDVDHGAYPFVTSSNPTAGGAIVGSGVSPDVVGDGHVIGVVKGYCSRVGNGPMPTEMDEALAADVRETVGGFGTVTGRPRRIGWLDLPMCRYAARVNGFTGITLTHVDTLATFEELRICTAYELDGERLTAVPATPAAWDRCEPVYERMDPWRDQDWADIAADGYDALPASARAYVELVGEELDATVHAVGVGPDRDDTIVRENPLEHPCGRQTVNTRR